jgi:hypothetical protein
VLDRRPALRYFAFYTQVSYAQKADVLQGRLSREAYNAESPSPDAWSRLLAALGIASELGRYQSSTVVVVGFVALDTYSQDLWKRRGGERGKEGRGGMFFCWQWL